MIETETNAYSSGTWLNVLGLLSWLAAMFLAVAAPLLSLPIPPLAIVGMVVFSGLFSILSLPRLMGQSKEPKK